MYFTYYIFYIVIGVQFTIHVNCTEGCKKSHDIVNEALKYLCIQWNILFVFVYENKTNQLKLCEGYIEY